jgi:hypothetical protein
MKTRNAVQKTAGSANICDPEKRENRQNVSVRLLQSFLYSVYTSFILCETGVDPDHLTNSCYLIWIYNCSILG